MAADVVLDPQTANPCCTELRKRYARLEEKRNALRQAVKLLEGQANKLEEENNALKRAHKEENARTELADQANKKSLEKKLELEKEIQQLKAEIVSLKKKGNAKNEGRNQMLISQVSEGKTEIKRLKELLQKESIKGDLEKKLEEEKTKAAEAWTLLRVEKKRAEEEKRSAEMERKKAEDFRSEANEARKKLELEKKKANKEKKRADAERAKFEEQMRLVEIERNKLAEEKAISSNLSKQLQEEMQKMEILQQKGLESCRTKKVRNEDAKTANVKFLREKVKFQKQQLKHAKKMSKLHEAEKHVLIQQLYLLKQDHVQFSNRLELLTSCFPYVIDDTNGLTKVCMNLKKHSLKPPIEFDKETKNKCVPKEYHDTSVPRGRGYIRPLSGTCSDSVRDKPQSSMICSTDVTFSDTRIGGPQERGALAVATSTQLDLNLSGEILVSRSISCDRNEVAIGAKRKAEDILEPTLRLKTKRKIRKGQKNSSPKKVMPSTHRGDDFESSEGDASGTMKQDHILSSPEQSGNCDERYGVDGSEHAPKSHDTLVNNHELYSFEGMDHGDYMKLLDLDDEAEEMKYQEARKMLLSPNLPEIKCPMLEGSLSELNYNLGFSHRDHLNCSLLPVQETSENSLQEANMDSEIIVQSTNQDFLAVTSTLENQKEKGQDCGATECMPSLGFTYDSGKVCNQVFSEDANVVDFLEINIDGGTPIDSSSGNQTAVIVESRADALNERNQPVYVCVLIPSNMVDEHAFHRILHVMDDIIHETSCKKYEGFMLTEVLHALSCNDDISSEEKVSVICSLLLHKTSTKISIPKDLSSLSSSLLSETNKVISLFLETCQLDIFIRILQDFIITKKIMVPGDDDPSGKSDFSKQFNYKNKNWFLRSGQPCQLIAGSMIMASMCLVLECTDILWHTSYHLLHSCMDDACWILTAVHVFASVSGSKLFSSTNGSLIPVVVKLILSLLERELEAKKNMGSWFSPCGECPYVEDEVSPDKVGYLLMEELHALLDDSKKSVDISLGAENSKDVLDGYCPLRNLASQLEHSLDIRVCCLTDTASLVELTGRYMGWEWLRRCIIPQLIKLLESHSRSQFSVPLLLLIRQLIRIGVKSNGGKIEEESESLLISSLSQFLVRETAGGTSRNLPMQFAAVEGLLSLLPLDFREIIRDPFDDAHLKGSRADCVQLIRRWFFGEIGEGQTSAAIGFFEQVQGR